MRYSGLKLALLAALMVGACDYWPKDLAPLAESVGREFSGETTALLVGGKVVVINVTGSPLMQGPDSALETAARDIAAQAIEFSETPLESIIITFYGGAVTPGPKQERDFIFLVREGRAVLGPDMDFDARGPLSAGEIQAAVDRMGAGLPEEQRTCVLEEMEQLAAEAGDPETLNPAELEYLSDTSWNLLDPFGKRLIFSQAITTRAVFDCALRQN